MIMLIARTRNFEFQVVGETVVHARSVMRAMFHEHCKHCDITYDNDFWNMVIRDADAIEIVAGIGLRDGVQIYPPQQEKGTQP